MSRQVAIPRALASAAHRNRAPAAGFRSIRRSTGGTRARADPGLCRLLHRQRPVAVLLKHGIRRERPDGSGCRARHRPHRQGLPAPRPQGRPARGRLGIIVAGNEDQPHARRLGTGGTRGHHRGAFALAQRLSSLGDEGWPRAECMRPACEPDLPGTRGSHADRLPAGVTAALVQALRRASGRRAPSAAARPCRPFRPAPAGRPEAAG